MRHLCDNCGRSYTDSDLHPVVGDLAARVDAGGIVPSGECTSCGALCYPVKNTEKSVVIAGNLLEDLRGMCAYVLETEYDSLLDYMKNEPMAEDFMTKEDNITLELGDEKEVSTMVDRVCLHPENTHMFALAFRLSREMPEEE